MNENFNLEHFESLVNSKDVESASKQFYKILDLLHTQQVVDIQSLMAAEVNDEHSVEHFFTRLCSAIGQLILNEQFNISIANFETLMKWQVILSKIFYLTPYANADHLLELMVKKSAAKIASGNDTIKIFILFLTESTLFNKFEFIFLQNKDFYVATCLMLVWGCSGTKQACINREWAYEKLPAFLSDTDTLNFPVSIIHGYFMHSSYGFAKNKHELKRIINKRLKSDISPFKPLANSYPLSDIHRRAINCNSIDLTKVASAKPVILVVLEIFNDVHSVYRVLGKSLTALKRDYTLVAVAWPGYVNIGEDYFDCLLTLSGAWHDYASSELYAIAAHFKPVAVYYPSIGMGHLTIFASNMRLAPLQFTAVGHGASSFATEIDYYLIEEDLCGDDETYSEVVVKVPASSMPFFAPTNIKYSPKNLMHEVKDGTVNIVCSASSMKINATFLDICRRIQVLYELKPIKIKFHFFIAIHDSGVSADSYLKLLKQYLPHAAIYKNTPFQTYVDLLADMDVSVSPFPYSGMNTVIDYANLGILGVRMQGPQVHEAIEPGMWRRMGMPEWLMANNTDEYIAAVCRLIDFPEERLALRRMLVDEQRWGVFFDGDTEQFVDTIGLLIAEKARP